MKVAASSKLSNPDAPKRYCTLVGSHARLTFAELVPGQLLQMFEPDGTPCDGGEVFTLTVAPFFCSPIGAWVLTSETVVDMVAAAKDKP